MVRDENQKTIVVVGGGPAGLHAAEIASRGGAMVVVLEAKRFVGRKFLVAGKSGLNLTNDESFDRFCRKYSGPAGRWEALLGRFDNEALRAWAADLGFETIVSSGGKVFPAVMKTAPLLRAWVRRLRELGVEFRFRERVVDLNEERDGSFTLSMESGGSQSGDAVIFALGGASWPTTGSDGNWTELFGNHGISLAPFAAANCGWEADFPEELIQRAEGLPLKNIEARAGEATCVGELTITRYGLEGGPIYYLGPVLREMESPVIYLDLKPSLSLSEVKARLQSVRRNFIRESKRKLKLGEAGAALLKYLPYLGPWKSSDTMAECIKSCPVYLTGPRPIEEAISTAGGISWSELTDELMLKKIPGVFVSGEMIDWEAPTGGYLLQGCFATGKVAGEGALEYLDLKNL